jgi:hypothetical protein
MRDILLKPAAITVLMLLISAAGATERRVYENKTTGLLTWTANDEGFKIELIQLIPDFVRAVYAKHHFPKQEVERVASYCVFGTILKNTSDQYLRYRVSDWRYQTKDGKQHPVKTKTQWLDEWRKAGILFSWTLLPDIGEFSVGDWQQGFTTIKLPRETTFDFIYKWQLDGVPHTGVLENIRCAPDALPETSELR